MLNTLKIFIRLLFSSFFLTFGDMVSLCGPGQPGTCYVDQVGLELRDFPTGPKGPSPCPDNTAIFSRLGCSFSCSDFFLFLGGGSLYILYISPVPYAIAGKDFFHLQPVFSLNCFLCCTEGFVFVRSPLLMVGLILGRTGLLFRTPFPCPILHCFPSSRFGSLRFFDSSGIDFCLGVYKYHFFFHSTCGSLGSLAEFTEETVLSLMYVFGALVKN